MKSLIIAAAMFVSLSAFAGREKVNEKVLNAFNTEFVNAQAVEWTISSDYYKASFEMNGQRVFAFYNTDGELMGLTRNISSSQLPVRLQSAGVNILPRSARFMLRMADNRLLPKSQLIQLVLLPPSLNNTQSRDQREE